MKLSEAIKVIKGIRIWQESDTIVSPPYSEKEWTKAIDTVVSHYEKSEKIEFLKSAKQPSEITHPYDLSKK